MTTSRTITLEILRDGPPHNQLLSPLTVYLAKCQNRPAESIRLSIDHGDFLRWQAGLTYAGLRRSQRFLDAQSTRIQELAASGVERRNAIADASKAVTNFFGSLRSLIAELACEPCEWRHIQLIVDASELGALPFELANAAPGLMVEGERLFVQQNARVTLTRQTHRVATSVVTWPSRPRILCVIADGNLPGDAHVLALWQAIDPWIGWNDGDPLSMNVLLEEEDKLRDDKLTENRVLEAEQILTILENPTLEKVSQVVSQTCFTHVHVLAHGAPLPDAEPGQALYGLSFRGVGGKVDIVDGDRLEAALRYPRDCHHPTVITLATCEGANLSGGILGPGGSVAHAIHTKGVPLVVASQFPLSKRASIVATEMLYKALFRGEDPRETLHAIRRELIVSHPDTHDWASLVMYASLPPDLASQLRRVKMISEKLAAETAVERLRVSLRGKRRSLLLTPKSDLPDDEKTNKVKAKLWKRIEGDIDRLDRAVSVARAWTDSQNDVATQIWSHRLVARICLRLWDTYCLRSLSSSTDPIPTSSTWTQIIHSVSEYLDRVEKHDFSSGQRPISMYSSEELLKLAKDSYQAAYFLDASRAEIWVQVVVLCWARGLKDVKREVFISDLKATRYMASLLTERVSTATGASREERALAAAVGFEVELLAAYALKDGTAVDAWQSITGSMKKQDAVDMAFDAFVLAASPIGESYRAHAAWKQLQRYEEWTKLTPLPNTNDYPGLNMANAYRLRLENLGVRRYWGPRT